MWCREMEVEMEEREVEMEVREVEMEEREIEMEEREMRRQMEMQEEKKYKKYVAEYTRFLKAKYFSDKTIFGGKYSWKIRCLDKE